MTDLVESILSLKMDSHTFDLHPTDLEVIEFLDECVDIMSTIRRDCVIHLEAASSTNDPHGSGIVEAGDTKYSFKLSAICRARDSDPYEYRW